MALKALLLVKDVRNGSAYNLGMATSDLLREFELHHNLYAGFAAKLKSLVTELLEGRNLKAHDVTARAKHRDSFERKVTRVEGKYATISAVTDLVGVRIITYFSSDVNAVAEVITSSFTVDTENSIDKRNLRDPDRFGYASVHYVVSFTPERAELPEYERYAGLKAEIQIRSILQHAWAEIEHDLGYKSVHAVPRGIKRQFSRLAGLLELADDEFVSIRRSLGHYVDELPKRIEVEPQSVVLDQESLKAFAAASTLVNDLDHKIARISGGRVSTTLSIPAAQMLDGLRVLEIETVAQLEDRLRSHADKLLRLASRWLEGSGQSVGSLVSLMYLAYTLLGEKQNIGLTKRFLKIFGIKDNPDGDGDGDGAGTAARILEAYQAL